MLNLKTDDPELENSLRQPMAIMIDLLLMPLHNLFSNKKSSVM